MPKPRSSISSIFFLLLSLIAWQNGLWADEPIQVTVRPLKQLLIHPLESTPAEVKSLNDGLISAQVTATIQAVPAQVGALVQAGDLLVQLDPWSYQLAQKQRSAERELLQAQLDNAKKRVDRTYQLQKQKQASEELLEQRQTEIKTLTAQLKGVEAALQEASLQTEKCQIKAPFAGVIVQRLARIGSTATPGTPLIQLVDTDTLELAAQISAEQLTTLTEANSWEFLHNGQHYPLGLRTVTPYADPITRTQEARLFFLAAKPIPGSAGRLLWKAPRPHLPPWTFVQRDNQFGIFLAKENKASFYPLPNAIEGQPTPIEPTLQGDLILSGREGLTHGRLIQAQPAPITTQE